MRFPRFLTGLTVKQDALDDVSALSAGMVRQLADLGLKSPAQSELARVLALLANARLLAFPAKAILPQGVVLVNGIGRAVGLMLPQPDPDQVEVAEFGTVLRYLRDDMRARLPAAVWPAVEAQSAALRAGLSLSGPAAETVTQSLCRCLTDLADLCLVTPMATVPVAQAMVEVLEAGAMPCGYLELEDPTEVEGRLCV